MSNRVHFNHLGQTITDIARSRRFYEDLLGFKFWWDFEVPDELSCKVLMVPSPCKLTATYLWRPDTSSSTSCTSATRAHKRCTRRGS